jgi:signal transduction histidine kinase
VSPALDQVGLAGALREEVTRLEHQAPRLALSLHLPDQHRGTMPAALEVVVYRVISEAVTDTLRHAGACRTNISITVTAQEVRLHVDDCAGMQEGWRTGVGIGAMRERAAELASRLAIAPRAPHGTGIIARLPLRKPA